VAYDTTTDKAVCLISAALRVCWFLSMTWTSKPTPSRPRSTSLSSRKDALAMSIACWRVRCRVSPLTGVGHAPPKSRHPSRDAGSSGGPTDLLLLLREVHGEYCERTWVQWTRTGEYLPGPILTWMPGVSGRPTMKSEGLEFPYAFHIKMREFQ